jgi:hypothetical protein
MALSFGALWYPGQNEEDWQLELDQAIERSIASQAFLEGKLDADDYLELVFQQGYEPEEIIEDVLTPRTGGGIL